MAKVGRQRAGRAVLERVPFRFGDGRYVKYKLEPEDAAGGRVPTTPPDYLRVDFATGCAPARPASASACSSRPTRKRCRSTRRRCAGVRRRAPRPRGHAHAARCRTSRPAARPTMARISRTTSGTPWRCTSRWAASPGAAGGLPASARRPARRQRHAARGADGAPAGGVEARRLRPAGEGCDRCVRAAIHPAIGVARVGNSPEGYFIGPEVTEPAPENPASTATTTGA